MIYLALQPESRAHGFANLCRLDLDQISVVALIIHYPATSNLYIQSADATP
jgi:hypothetical protein